MGIFFKLKNKTNSEITKIVKYWKKLSNTLKSISLVLGAVLLILTQWESICDRINSINSRNKMTPELINRVKRIETDTLSKIEIQELLFECGQKKDGLEYVIEEFGEEGTMWYEKLKKAIEIAEEEVKQGNIW